MGVPNARAPGFALRNTGARTSHDDIKVHAKNTDTRVVTCTEIDVFLDAKAKVPCLREVAASEFVLLHLEATFKNLLGFGPSNGNMDGDFLVTTDAECSDGVPRLGGHGGLASELLEHFRRPCQTIARFANGDVNDQFVNFELLHRIDGGAFGVGLHSFIKQTSVSTDPQKAVASNYAPFFAREKRKEDKRGA